MGNNTYAIYAEYLIAGTTWSSAYQLSTVKSTISKPQVAIDSTGAATVIWTQLDSPDTHVYVSRYTPGSGWGSPTSLDSNVSVEPSAVSVAMNGVGGAMAVFRTQYTGSSTGQAIFATQYTVGTGWGTVQTIASGAIVGDPVVAFDSIGNAIVVWSGNSVYANRYVSGSGWSGAVQIYADGQNASLSMASNGKAIVAFELVGNTSTGTLPNILASIYTPAAGWSAATSVALPSSLAADNPLSYPVAAINNTGDAIVAWSQASASTGRSDLWANTYKTSSGWNAAQIIESDTPFSSVVDEVSAPDVAIRADGSAFAVWQQTVSSLVYRIYANKYDPAAGWGTASRLENGTTGASGSGSELAHIGLDGSGNALAVWDCFDAASNGRRIFAAFYN